MKKNKLSIIIAISIILSGCSLFQSQEPVNTNEEKPNGENMQTNGTQQNEIPQSDKKLDLSNQNLQKLPEYVFKQTNLEELDVSNNQLSGAIQAEIRHLQNLKILDASNNQMTGVPAEIGQLRNLQVLNLSNNQLTGLPYELGNLEKLKIFNISGNNYSELDLGIIREKLPNDVNIIN